MAWSGGTFTRVDGSTGWQDDEAAGTGIEAGLMDTAFNDLATSGINETLNKAGQNSPTANLPMGGFKHTGVANASANDEYTTQGQLQDGSFRPNFLNPISTGNVTFWRQANLYNGGPSVEQINASGSATVGVDAAVVNGQLLNRVDIQGYNGSGYARAVEISATCTNTPVAGNYIPAEYKVRVGNSTGTALNTGFIIANDLTTYLPGAYLTTTANAANVYVFNTGGLARSTSSIRYKENVQPMTTGLEAVKQLKPVTFNEKNNDSGKLFAGLIAEDLDEQGLKEYVSYDEEGRADAIHYGNLVALAFKAIQELETKVASLEAQIARS